MNIGLLIILLLLIINNIFAQNTKSEIYREPSIIKVNQVGYIPSRRKLFMVSNANPSSFAIIDNKTKEVVYKGKFVEKIYDKDTGEHVHIGDFTDFRKEGEYYIEILPSKEKSYVFKISSNVFNDVFVVTMRSFYLQRCGSKVYNDKGELIYDACHLDDAEFLEEHFGKSLSGIKKDFTGGWHDAGDYGKYIVNAGITCGTLLLMFEFNEEKLKNINLNIPKNYKNLPDVLEEIKYELDWFLKMQTDDGGVYFKVASKGFPGFCLPNKDKSKRFVYGVSSVATANFAAVMAMAARVYKNYLPEYSRQCLEAAEKAWKYLIQNPEIVPKGGFDDPFLKDAGYEGDTDDTDERLWAAAELFATTFKKEYNDYFIENYKKWTPTIDYLPSWIDLHVFGMIRYLLTPQADEKIKQQIKTDLVSYLNKIIATIVKRSGYRVALKHDMYYWGSNAVALNNGLLFIVGYRVTKNEEYLDTAFDQLCYILGRNSLDKSFVTEVGYNYPMNPHHGVMVALKTVLPGFLVGGPNKDLEDFVLYRNFGKDPNYPVAKRYIDIDPTTANLERGYKGQTSFASNEPCISYNAPLEFVLAEFIY